MSITSKENLLKLINDECKISPALTFDDVDISLPEVVSVDGRDSKVELTSKLKDDEGTVVEVWYHRRDLPDYLKNDLSFGDEDVVSTHDLLQAINERFKLNLLPEDIEDNPVDKAEHLVVAVPTSHEWRGDVLIKMIKALPLSDLIQTTDLSGLLYPDHQQTDYGQAALYSYPVDCSHISRFLNLLVTGVQVDDTALAVELNKVVSDVWVAKDEPADWNLRGATVVFDGETRNLVGANTKFAYVVSVQLTDLCTNFRGTLNLHYNL